MLITGGAITFGYLLSQDDEDEQQSQTTAVRGAQDSGLQVSQSGSGTGQLLSQGADPQDIASNSEQSESNRLPGPDDFEVYEQYADETNALYAEVAIGSGATARQGDTVAVSYAGWLTDGTLFDASGTNENGEIEAFSFQLGQGQVIRGWEEGIVGMQVGGTRRLVIPSVAAYGEQGQGQIPPDAMLIFDVELLQIQAAQPQPGL